MTDRSATESLCPVCLRRLAAWRVTRGDQVFLVKHCPRHGEFRTPVWRGTPHFDDWRRPKIPVAPPVTFSKVDRGCPFDCGLCPEHRQRSCTVIIEVTQQCDLACPVCYAAAPARQADPTLQALGELFAQARRASSGCNIQLSGGEPTQRDDLPAIVALARETGCHFVQLNTNGLRLAQDREYVRGLKQAGLGSVFLQFDGTEDYIHRRLRGRPLMAVKQAAVAACAQHGIGVVLVPTLVPGVNIHNIGAILQTALQWAPAVRGVHFQPVSYFGRYPSPPDDDARVTLPEVIQAIEAQSGGLFKGAHFSPPGCENALCSFNGNFLQQPGGTVIALKKTFRETCRAKPVPADQGAARAMAFVARQWSGREPCPAVAMNAAPTPAVLPFAAAKAPMSMDQFIQQARTHTFTVSAMAFQDAWSIALDRARDCCIHVMAPDGRLIPFCLYNLTASDGRRLYRP